MKHVLLYILALCAYFLGSYGIYIIKRRKLGELKLKISIEAVRAKSLSKVFAIGVIVLGASYYLYHFRDLNTFVDYFGIITIGILTGSVILSFIRGFMPIGFYEYGVITLSGIAFYINIEGYKKKTDKNSMITNIEFTPSNKKVSKMNYIYVNNKEINKVERFLKANQIIKNA